MISPKEMLQCHWSDFKILVSRIFWAKFDTQHAKRTSINCIAYCRNNMMSCTIKLTVAVYTDTKCLSSIIGLCTYYTRGTLHAASLTQSRAWQLQTCSERYVGNVIVQVS